MKSCGLDFRLAALAPIALLLSSCVSYPTLVEVARERTGAKPKDVTAPYHITDLDVLNYTDRIKILLAAKTDKSALTRYTSSTTGGTLTALAGAASTAGWSTATASGLGLGAAFVLSLQNVFNAKGDALAYEQAFTAVQAAESTYYFRQLKMSFKKDGDHYVVDTSNVPNVPQNNIPSPDRLTPDGETLYYRTSKIIKVLDDVLASKIPDLDDLKDAKGETSGKAPAKANPASAN